MRKTAVKFHYSKTSYTLFLFILLVLMGCGGGSGGSGSSAGITGDSSVPTEGGTVSLNWNAPTTNEDGSPLTDLGGYKVYYGTSSENYAASVDVGNTTSFSTSLFPGVYCFALTSYDTSGNESVYSNEVCKTIS